MARKITKVQTKINHKNKEKRYNKKVDKIVELVEGCTTEQLISLKEESEEKELSLIGVMTLLAIGFELEKRKL